MKISTELSPTDDIYHALQKAHDWYNQHLFGNQLSACVITLQREKNTCGYFSAKRFANADGIKAHEIALNPSYFAVQPVLETLQTLVHEMCHQWQLEHGKPSRGRYHNSEWAEKMESIGLMPSSTGRPGGAKTGDRMADYAISNGQFIKVSEALMQEGFEILWYDRFPAQVVKLAASKLYSANHSGKLQGTSALLIERPIISLDDALNLAISDGSHFQELNLESHVKPEQVNKQTRMKYSCSCSNLIWGKPNLLIRCEVCDERFVHKQS